MTLTSPLSGYPLERIAGSVGEMALWSAQFDIVAEHLGAARSASPPRAGRRRAGR